MNNNEAKKTILEAESCFCKHGAYKDCHSGCKYREALDAAIKALEQEPTTKNNLGVDCIDRKFAISVLNDVFHGAISDSNMRVYEIINWLNGLPSVTPQEPIKKLEEQIKQLQNRCHALTHGQICVFCPYECEHKAETEPQESEK